MSSRNDAFQSDPESHSSVLKSLGYSEEEISGTPGEATPDDLRLSLRQLSAAHSSDVSERHQPSTPFSEKNFHNPGQIVPDPEKAHSADYLQGRKDEAILRKSNMNPGGGGVPAPKKPRGNPQRAAERQTRQTMKQLGRIMSTFGGSRSASKALGGVTRAQKGRR